MVQHLQEKLSNTFGPALSSTTVGDWEKVAKKKEGQAKEKADVAATGKEKAKALEAITRAAAPLDVIEVRQEIC